MWNLFDEVLRDKPAYVNRNTNSRERERERERERGGEVMVERTVKRTVLKHFFFLTFRVDFSPLSSLYRMNKKCKAGK